MRVQVKKWGNSASVRIPASVMAAVSLRIDQAVDVREEGGRVIIEPVADAGYDLDDLLARMTPDTFPEEVDLGRPVGGEIPAKGYVPAEWDCSGSGSIPRRAMSRPAAALRGSFPRLATIGSQGLVICCPMTRG